MASQPYQRVRYAGITQRLQAEMAEVTRQRDLVADANVSLAAQLRRSEDDVMRHARKLALWESQLVTLMNSCDRWYLRQPAAAIRMILSGEAKP